MATPETAAKSNGAGKSIEDMTIRGDGNGVAGL